jgi:hypothetical protein
MQLLFFRVTAHSVDRLIYTKFNQELKSERKNIFTNRLVEHKKIKPAK